MKPNTHPPIIFFILFSFFLILSGCGSNGTDPAESTITLSGTVTLEGQSDHSGITVAIYKPVDLDTALVRINQQYPNIGVQISQETEFDHREHTPVATTVTDAAGNWKIEKVPAGTYHVVAEKEGYGWRYKLDVQGGRIDQRLSEVVVQKGILNGNITWESGKTYFLEGDVTVAPGAVLTIENNVWCLAKANSRLIIEGRIVKNSEGFAFFTPQNLTDTWRGILLSSSSNTLKYVVINDSNIGLISRNQQNLFENSIIRNASSVGLNITQSGAGSVFKNLLLLRNFAGLDIFNIDSTCIFSHSVIIDSENEGIQLTDAELKIEYNVIKKNHIGILCLFDSNALIKNCEIIDNKTFGIEISGSDPKIIYNSIEKNGAEAIYISPRGYAKESRPIVNFNNFSSKATIVLKILGLRTGRNSNNIDATNNWWSTVDSNLINTFIFDRNDFDPQDTIYYPYTGVILYEPFLSSKEVLAGITI